MKTLFSILLISLFFMSSGCGQTQPNQEQTQTSKKFPLYKPNSEWKKILSPTTYEVMVNKGTEPAFNNPYNSLYQKGIYVSAATGEPLFSSDDKYDSGTGWPSFTKPINPQAVIVIKENSNEVIEAKTGLHLGHVFNDGPVDKGGKRYCMNSAALKFIKK
ncbi:MAG TPA: peptide-methionine (R)-S-oxide reductase MsrB [Daejeonella sp.]|nr:peptide-methionine (R)-S-oxide reductase MsrB [Daejeonella sp.]